MRQFNEGVKTACCSADICMNSKADFHQPSIVRVTITLENRHEEQTGTQSQRGEGAKEELAGEPGGGQAGLPAPGA